MIGYLRPLFLAGIAAIILGFSISSPALAGDAQIKFRRMIMSSIGGTMGGLVTVLKKQASSDYAAPLASNMNALAKIAGGIFPTDSDFGETNALPVIWEKPAEFKKGLVAFQAAAAHLSKVAASGDMTAFGPAISSLGKACKACHQNFRKKRE